MRLSMLVTFSLLPLLMGALAGCPADEETGAIVTTKASPKTRSTAAPSSGLITVVATGSPSPSSTGTPAPVPTAPPVAVTAVVVNTLALSLYLLPLNASLSLGLPTQATLSAFARRTNGTQGEVTWLDRSNGQLTVTTGGAVAVKTTTSTGSYYVRAQSLDDPNLYADVNVRVGSLGNLDLTIQ